mmetsp:Transcript_13449/g.33849  ORF Transcript_13449/g.33849 Transcript_13449/m.33849 type:complete len:554 (-) Transcript_13449:87-1748(-)
MGRGKSDNVVENECNNNSHISSNYRNNCNSIFGFAVNGNIEAVKQSLMTLSSSAIYHLCDKKGSTPLHYAAGNGHFETCRLLLQTVQGQATHSSSFNNIASSYANKPNKTQGRTALHWAARNGHLSVCKLLVEDYGADPDLLAKGDVTPLQLAVWRGHVEVCFWLSKAGTADKHFVNKWGCTVHHWLAKSPIYTEQKQIEEKHQQAMDAEAKLLILCQWLDDDERDNNNNNDNNNESTKLSAWNRPNDHGQTPLHKAGFGGNLPVLKFLIETKGCSDTHRDSQHNTAADCAERNRQWEVAKFLRRHGNPRCLQTASAILFPGMQPRKPRLAQIRACYLKLAKLYHPDRSKTILDKNRWRDLQQAYRLWTLWWEDPEEADAMIRGLERHHFLQRQLPLLVLWHKPWHESEKNNHEEKRESSFQKHGLRNAKKQKVRDNNNNRNANHRAQQGFSETALQKLEDFERKLVRLLGTLPSHEIPLSQLPKEYEKTWANNDGTKAMIRPRDYCCKKLRFLLDKHCSRTVTLVPKPRDIDIPSNGETAGVAILWVRLKDI